MKEFGGSADRLGLGLVTFTGQIARPLGHQDTPALEQVRTRIGRFHLTVKLSAGGGASGRRPGGYAIALSLASLAVACVDRGPSDTVEQFYTMLAQGCEWLSK